MLPSTGRHSVADVESAFALLSLRVGMDKGILLLSPLPPSSPEYSPADRSLSWSPSPLPHIPPHTCLLLPTSSTSRVGSGKDLKRGQGNSQRKSSKPYSQGQRVTLQNPGQQLRMEVERFYSGLRKEYSSYGAEAPLIPSSFKADVFNVSERTNTSKKWSMFTYIREPLKLIEASAPEASRQPS